MTRNKLRKNVTGSKQFYYYLIPNPDNPDRSVHDTASSWPGLSRPSTRRRCKKASSLAALNGVDARDKPGHDGGELGDSSLMSRPYKVLVLEQIPSGLDRLLSFPRKRESRGTRRALAPWVPAFAGTTRRRQRFNLFGNRSTARCTLVRCALTTGISRLCGRRRNF